MHLQGKAPCRQGGRRTRLLAARPRGPLSDTSQSTSDRTRYAAGLCPCRRTVLKARDTPCVQPMISCHRRPQGTQSAAHAATPGTCGCHQPLCHPIQPPCSRARKPLRCIATAVPCASNASSHHCRPASDQTMVHLLLRAGSCNATLH